MQSKALSSPHICWHPQRGRKLKERGSISHKADGGTKPTGSRKTYLTPINEGWFSAPGAKGSVIDFVIVSSDLQQYILDTRVKNGGDCQTDLVNPDVLRTFATPVENPVADYVPVIEPVPT
ncbi:hypothetical protein L3Q82_002973 [Scortum barcoo]|uniref:Uncharacterized protein n=1 Tax=Scortum barcoo TaxID=214431 RepID=A0ACB8VT60_9TELE|nr:hypothetical protein L3Q82_002973 [Scortum barcoo]